MVDAATVLSTHLTELIKANVSELISYAEVDKLIKDLPKEQSELVKDIVPSQITVSGIQRVLQLLLAERVSIRDLATILEGIADAIAFTRNPATLAEHVRARLSRQLCAQYTTPAGHLPIIALTARWEQNFAEVDHRPGRRAHARHAALAADRVHHAGAGALRGRRPAGRGAGAGDLGRRRGRSCAGSSSASGRRPRCCRRPKSTRGRGSRRSAASEARRGGLASSCSVPTDRFGHGFAQYLAVLRSGAAATAGDCSTFREAGVRRLGTFAAYYVIRVSEIGGMWPTVPARALAEACVCARAGYRTRLTEP